MTYILYQEFVSPDHANLDCEDCEPWSGTWVDKATICCVSVTRRRCFLASVRSILRATMSVAGNRLTLAAYVFISSSRINVEALTEGPSPSQDTLKAYEVSDHPDKSRI
jgi:hypothetical protein